MLRGIAAPLNAYNLLFLYGLYVIFFGSPKRVVPGRRERLARLRVCGARRRLKGRTMPDQEWPPLSPLHTGLRGRCPRCGQGHMFDGFLKLRRGCEVCGLDYSFADPADGPAFFVICFACVPSVFLGVAGGAIQRTPLGPSPGHRAVHAPDLHSAVEAVKGVVGGEPVFLQGRGGQGGSPGRSRGAGEFERDRPALNADLGHYPRISPEKARSFCRASCDL